MRWRGKRQSSNVDDRRQSSGSGGLGGLFGRGRSGGGGGMRMPGGRRGGGLGIGTILIGLAIAWLLGINPLQVLGMFTGGGSTMPTMEARSPQQPMPRTNTGQTGNQSIDDEMGQFVSVVLGSTEDVWGRAFKAAGATYPAPKLVLYRGSTTTACGMGSSAAGPFYCPADQKCISTSRSTRP